MAESRISPYNLADLKNTTDDALGNYCRGLGFKQDNSKLDVRLALGYVAVVIAGATFAADYKLGWEATKYWTAVAVAAYAILNGALTYWIWAVEKGLVFEGTRSGKKMTIFSRTQKHDPTYYLEIHTSSLANSNDTSTREIKVPFTTWFTQDGYFVAKPFQQWLASSVEAVGDADLKNANRDERDELAAPTAQYELLQTAAEGQAATGVEGAGKGSQRKSKRKA
ncbi:Putative signal peptidase complex subunit Spc2/SPCS2 [Septoria linicola]|uniref:Signal peptidase complex subunit 2 n=1 Tax=Septoria linicola TaxID=215465 RepID=A0A9Q9AJL9_9PEZI|nr:Putative signal peptidase complex subunit Spc2/SPCS2 [Septoria linicola]